MLLGAPATPVQVWKLFPVVAAAVESMQPGAQAAAASFIAASVWGRKAEQPPAATVEAEQAMLQQASIEGAAAASPAGNGKESGTGSNSSKSSLTAMEALGSGGARPALHARLASRPSHSSGSVIASGRIQNAHLVPACTTLQCL